jgi:chemotaxis protein methyltransferase CheR
MSGAACAELLQWALPRLALRWEGFRRVRRQVCRRIDARIKIMGLSGVPAYRRFLEDHPDEWRVLDGCCLVSISRFARDHEVFDQLAASVLPALATAAVRRASLAVRAWSAGCASGEEAYTLLLYWHVRVRPRFPRIAFHVIGTDMDPVLLARAEAAAYRASSMRELPPALRDAGFRREGAKFVLRDEFRTVEFLLQDLRAQTPAAPFDLVLCRNVAFTYFDPALQRRTLERVLGTLQPGGGLVIGRKEQLPHVAHGPEPWFPALGIFQKDRREDRHR